MLKKINLLLSRKINTISAAAFLIALSSLFSRFLGIFRDRILASEFGAGSELDVYYAAFRLPDFIFNLLVLGALSAGFVPVFSNLIKKKLISNDYQKAWLLLSRVINILGVALVVLCLLGMVFSPFLMKIIAPGFSDENIKIASRMTRIMFLSPFFLGISSVFGGVLQSFKRFFVYSLSPIVYNLGIILGAIYLVPVFGIFSLAWGVVLGAFLHMLIQFPTVFSLGFKYKFDFNWRDKNLIKIGKMMIPRTMSLAISQINLLTITIIASLLPVGSLAVFNFANNLQSFPVGIFGISFAVAAFPALSMSANNKKKLMENFSSTFRNILFFIVPSTILLIILRAQIIRVILGAGRFDWEDTVLTIDTLGFFTLSLFAQALIPLLIRVFYARQDSKTPFIIGFISALLNIILSWHFSSTMGVAGLALAFSLANIFNFILLWASLRFYLGNMDETKILFSSLKFFLAGLGAGFAAQITKYLVWPFIDMTKFWGVLVQGLSAGLIGLFVYFLISAFLRTEEFFSFWRIIKCKCLPVKKRNSSDQGEARGI